MRFPYLKLANGQEPFVERRVSAPPALPAAEPKPAPEPERPKELANEQTLFFQ
jgi:hypothetical protein